MKASGATLPGDAARPASRPVGAAGDGAPGAGPWKLAWTLVVPLAAWLAFTKTVLVMNGFFWAPKDSVGLLAIANWLSWFTSVRFLFAVVVACVIQRLLFKRHRWTIVPIALAVVLALAVLLTALKPDQTIAATIAKWSLTAWAQYRGILTCLWRDAVSVAWIVLVFGIVIRLTPRAAQAAVVTALQVVVVLLCLLVGIDLAYQFATGQPASTRVLLFALESAKEMAPLVKSEVTGPRLLGLFAGAVLALAWAWYTRRIVRQPVRKGRGTYEGGVLALVVALGILLPVPNPGAAEVVRFSEGTLVTLVRTALPSAGQEVDIRVAQEFQRIGRPPWFSAAMTLQPTERTHRRNVVLVMMESIRAKSSTVNTPALATMPFLAKLAGEGLMVEDMSAVAPRTAAAWMAILAGQYPLANQDTASWAVLNQKAPRIRSLPLALREAGYATSFFTPTDMRFQSDPEIIRSFNFEFVRTEPELAKPGDEWPTYFGIADEAMLAPIRSWTQTQVQAKRPFFTAIMTNVGHHNFQTPSTWKKIRFEGVDDPVLQSYYNCLAYIDSVLSRLVEGYRQLGVLDDTIFVFVGDHGVLFEEHNAKQSFNTVYQEALRVPAVIYAPGMSLRGTRVQGARQQIDILPTIADLLGLRIEGAQLPGQSLLAPVAADREVFFTSSIDWSALAMRRGPRKYIYTLDGRPMEAFDLDRDPNELSPLADVPAPEMADAQARMLEWRARAELSMFARPGDAPGAPWLRK